MSDQQYHVLVASDDGEFCDGVPTNSSQKISAFKASLQQDPRLRLRVTSIDEIKLFLEDVELENEALIKHYNINSESFIRMQISSDDSPSADDNIEIVAEDMKIYIGFLSGNKPGYSLEINPASTIEDLKALVMSKSSEYEPSRQRVFMNGRNLRDDKTLHHYNVEDNANLLVMLKEPDLIPSNVEGCMLLYVSYENKIHTICITEDNATIRHVKKLVWEKTDILPAFQRLNFHGEDLESPDKRVSAYENESLLYLFKRNERYPEEGYSVLPPHENPDLVLAAYERGGNQNQANDTVILNLMMPISGDGDIPTSLEIKKDVPLRQVFHTYSMQKMGMPASSLQFLHQEYGDLTGNCELSAEELGIESGSTLMVVPNIQDMQEPLAAAQNSVHSNDIDLTPFSDPGTKISVTLRFDNQLVEAAIIKETTPLSLLFSFAAEEFDVSPNNSLMYRCNGKLYRNNIDKTAAQCGIENGYRFRAILQTDVETEAKATISKFFDARIAQRKIAAERHRARNMICDFILGSIASKNWQKLRNKTKLIQKVVRGYSARKIYGDMVQARLAEYRQFSSVWKQTASAAAALVSAPPQGLTGWALERNNMNLKRTEDIDEDGNLAETDNKLNKALAGALEETYDSDELADDEVLSDQRNIASENNLIDAQDDKMSNIDWSQFQVTHHVCKFLKNGDAKYREIFVKKMKQLGRGERSHKLQKPLQGCKAVIYETYLENKSGWRILWTEENGRQIIWFVCQHKAVSRLAKLIDDAKNRAERQQLPNSFISEVNDASLHENKIDIKLDPIGNVPLKLYDIGFEGVDDIVTDSWTPQMHLTPDEEEVVKAKGTVLLLGRSGTGKTCVIINKMEFDRARRGHNLLNFTQLFVSRSKQLCRYVKDAVGDNECSSFTTFDELAYQIEASLSDFICRSFQRSRRVDFNRFKNEFYTQQYPHNSIDALIVWKAIRTFLRGSIEAFQMKDKQLSRDYFVGEQLGKNRCKVPQHLRDTIYDINLQYQEWVDEKGLWDDCHRIVALLQGIENAKKSQSTVYEDKVKRTRLYVDEVQDYTQLEILLFFYIGAGPGALFLAGDPAQSVVEGTDFRFDEIRSVGHYVAGDKRHLIPEKPKVVNVNFRSHAGILNCAGGLLDILFQHFPGSAKQLPRDFGLFKGARPGVFQRVQVEQLSTLLKEKMPGAIVLTHDESAASWRDQLDHKLVYGIREAKGMEFKTVIILDFFSGLPSTLQKPMRDLLLNRYKEEDDFQHDFPLIEVHLKLIYTAVTRCIERLFFAETTPSTSGDAAVRWLTTNTIANRSSDNEVFATVNDVKDLESMSMTNDEFCVVGIDNAEAAETAVDLPFETILDYLERAIYCFEKAQSSELAVKARVHSTSINLRNRLTSSQGSMTIDDMKSLEKEVSNTINLLLKENLLGESLYLLHAFTPLVSPYVREKLEESIATPINRINTSL